MVLTTGYPKNKIRSLPYIIYRNYQQGSQTNIRAKTFKLFTKKKKGVNLNDPGLCKALLDMTPKAHNTRKKQTNWTS